MKAFLKKYHTGAELTRQRKKEYSRQREKNMEKLCSRRETASTKDWKNAKCGWRGKEQGGAQYEMR